MKEIILFVDQGLNGIGDSIPDSSDYKVSVISKSGLCYNIDLVGEVRRGLQGSSESCDKIVVFHLGLKHLADADSFDTLSSFMTWLKDELRRQFPDVYFAVSTVMPPEGASFEQRGRVLDYNKAVSSAFNVPLLKCTVAAAPDDNSFFVINTHKKFNRKRDIPVYAPGTMTLTGAGRQAVGTHFSNAVATIGRLIDIARQNVDPNADRPALKPLRSIKRQLQNSPAPRRPASRPGSDGSSSDNEDIDISPPRRTTSRASNHSAASGGSQTAGTASSGRSSGQSVYVAPHKRPRNRASPLMDLARAAELVEAGRRQQLDPRPAAAPAVVTSEQASRRFAGGFGLPPWLRKQEDHQQQEKPVPRGVWGGGFGLPPWRVKEAAQQQSDEESEAEKENECAVESRMFVFTAGGDRGGDQVKEKDVLQMMSPRGTEDWEVEFKAGYQKENWDLEMDYTNDQVIKQIVMAHQAPVLLQQNRKGYGYGGQEPRLPPARRRNLSKREYDRYRKRSGAETKAFKNWCEQRMARKNESRILF